MPVSPARATAFDILLRVERESAYASELLHATSHGRLSAQDHALATELVMGVLRWRSRLDDEITRASSHPLAKLDLEIVIALRLAVYQFHWLDRVPQRAALHESVELVKRARKRSAAPFVNAVLRKLAAEAETRTLRDTPESGSAETFARAWAHPRWLVERWAKSYGLTAALQICKDNQSIPKTTVRLRTATVQAQLREAGIILAPGSLLASAGRVESGDVAATAAFRAGEVVIQDEASQLVAALVGSGSRILDCCAAPGGKTLALADRNPEAEITAVELHPHRALALQERISGSHLGGRIRVLAGDATRLPISAPFERVLADVPCSGTGTLARNPEIKWRLSPHVSPQDVSPQDDLRELHDRQTAILRSALTQVAPGGRLIYSTCSLEKEENENVVEEVLADHRDSFRLLDCRPELDRLRAAGELIWPEPASLTQGPYLRTIPGIHPCEGFFAAILEKT